MKNFSLTGEINTSILNYHCLSIRKTFAALVSIESSPNMGFLFGFIKIQT